MAFYYKDETDFQEAPNFVVFPDGTELFADSKDIYTYPVYGWYWFDTLEEAKEFFGIKE